MRWLFALFVLVLPVPAQLPVPVENIYTFVKNNSAFRGDVEWTTIDATFAKCTKAARSGSENLGCIVGVLRELGDVHTSIYYDGKTYGHYAPISDVEYRRIKPLRDQAIVNSGKFFATSVGKKFVYVRVPGVSAFARDAVDAKGKELAKLICTTVNKDSKGVIVDLRMNTGGNMYPMLTGLSSLIGNGKIGSEVDAGGKVARTWVLENGKLKLSETVVADVGNACDRDLNRMKVAVLIGPITSSSGAMTAIAFKGRAKTRFFGEPTAAGYTTSNGYFQFAPNLTMNFATHFVADRNSNIYKLNVSPDEIINDAVDPDRQMDDMAIKAAIRWLK